MGDERIEPTRERLKKGDDIADVVIEMGEGEQKERVATRRAQDTLDMLVSRGVITGDQFAAGRQLYADWYQAGFAASGVIDPAKEVVDGGKVDLLNDSILDAASRFINAIKYLRDDEDHRHVLINVVLMEESLAEYGWRVDGFRDVERAKLAAQMRLKLALTKLDYHYYGKRRTKGGSSHAKDYRPAIPPRS